MKNKLTRRNVIEKMVTGTAMISGAASLPLSSSASQRDDIRKDRNGNINHSVCQWCYDSIPLEKLCKSAKDMGIKSVELLGVKDWPLLKEYGLTCAMGYTAGAGRDIEKNFNLISFHDELVKSYEEAIPLAAKAGVPQLITFSGNKNGMGNDAGIKNCAMGIKRIMKTAEKYKITIAMELLNSKVDHHDYQCDHTAWGVELVKAVGSDRFKLLYDIYHMQIMEGDVIRTIQDNHQYISHYHTGGVPGRHEIDSTQELNYPAIMRAILATGFTGYVAQEFIPSRQDPMKSLHESIDICDV